MLMMMICMYFLTVLLTCVAFWNNVCARNDKLLQSEISDHDLIQQLIACVHDLESREGRSRSQFDRQGVEIVENREEISRLKNILKQYEKVVREVQLILDCS